MKILVAGDLHFNKRQFSWLEEQKAYFDCLCLTGDFLDTSSGSFEEQTEWVSAWLARLETQVFVCSGNHDLDDLADCAWLGEAGSSHLCSDNQRKLFNGIRFGCIPYLGAELSDFSNCDVLITHIPPANTATSLSVEKGVRRDWGDEELYHALKGHVVTPRYVLCGHVESPVENRAYLAGTEIVNPGARHDAPIPRHETVIIHRGWRNIQ